VRRALLLLLLVGCTRRAEPNAGFDPPPDADAVDAPDPDAPFVDKAGPCVSSFGQDLPDGFGRLDGTIVAVVPPLHPSCAASNDDHLILEIRQNGRVYRIVTAVISRVGNPDMAFAERAAPLSGPAWSEGWHPGLDLDYVTHLGLHRLDLTPRTEAELVYSLNSRLELGARVSVYGTVENDPASAHLIHRTGNSATDGAIVIDPDTAPRYLALRFDNQLF
jgi:hypothetical protein